MLLADAGTAVKNFFGLVCWSSIRAGCVRKKIVFLQRGRGDHPYVVVSALSIGVSAFDTPFVPALVGIRRLL